MLWQLLANYDCTVDINGIEAGCEVVECLFCGYCFHGGAPNQRLCSPFRVVAESSNDVADD